MYKYIKNSLYTDSRGYDPLGQRDIIRVRIADGRLLTDRRDEFYGVTFLRMSAPGNVEYLQTGGQGVVPIRHQHGL